jgi:hypothetical protein
MQSCLCEDNVWAMKLKTVYFSGFPLDEELVFGKVQVQGGRSECGREQLH